jgi:hypothetical protein
LLVRLLERLNLQRNGWMSRLIGRRQVGPDGYYLDRSGVLGLGCYGTDLLPVVAGGSVAGQSGVDLEMRSGTSFSRCSGSDQPANLVDRLRGHVDAGSHEWREVLVDAVQPRQHRPSVPGFAEL